jgi:hypothetical protein
MGEWAFRQAIPAAPMPGADQRIDMADVALYDPDRRQEQKE